MAEFGKEVESEMKQGLPVKYRAIVQYGEVKAVLYAFQGAVGMVKFEEVKLATEEIVDVSRLELPKTKYAKIQAVPVEIVVGPEGEKMELEHTPPQYETVLACRGRFAENLLGYVDVELIPESEEKPANFKEVSVPVCECVKDVKSEGKAWFQKQLAEWNHKRQQRIDTIAAKAKEVVVRYQKISGPEVEKMKALLEESREVEGELVALPDDDLSSEFAVNFVFFYCQMKWAST